MPGNPSAITTTLSVDPALVQNATFRQDANDRQSIDNQIRGVEQHLVVGLINGTLATWVSVDASSAPIAVGDVVCLAGSTIGIPTVTRAVAGAMTAALSGYGMALVAASPGAKCLVATGGVVAPSVSGLAAVSGVVKINTATARAAQAASFAAGDFTLGTVDAQGYLRIEPGYAYPGGSGVTALAGLNIDWSLTSVYTKTLAGGVNTITFSNQTAGAVIIARLTGVASTVAWPALRWPGGTPPVQTASGTDAYTFFHDGTNVYGSYVQAMA